MSKFTNLIEEFRLTQKIWLVTGIAGFIGSNLAEFLLSNNQKVVGLDNFSTGYQKNLDMVKESVGEKNYANLNFIKGDISNYDTCHKACKGVDIILHQAALGSVPRSIADPITSNLSNITGFLNMLTASKNQGVKRFVYASSSSVYGDSSELPKVEERTGNLLSPYAVMKYTNELYAGVFTRTYGIECVGLRYFNVFGKRQDPDGAYAAVIPKWVSSILSDDDVYINGDGETSRDFCYIDNVIQMNLLAGTTSNEEAFGEAFNVAVGGQTTLNELYSLINKELESNVDGFEPKEAIYRNFREGDIRHSNANISKAKKLVGYSPSYTIDEGMHLAINWYIENLKTVSN